MSTCFLDTSVLVDLSRGRAAAQAAVGSYEELFLSFVALGELVAGVHGADDPATEWVRLEACLSRVEVVGSDEETAYIYGDLLGGLEREGKRIPTNDIWSAAGAVQLELPLLARDEHFRRLSRLRWVGY